MDVHLQNGMSYVGFQRWFYMCYTPNICFYALQAKKSIRRSFIPEQAHFQTAHAQW